MLCGVCYVFKGGHGGTNGRETTQRKTENRDVARVARDSRKKRLHARIKRRDEDRKWDAAELPVSY